MPTEDALTDTTEEIDWGQPLSNTRHEEIALLVATGDSWASAYFQVYGGDWDTCRKNVWLVKTQHGVSQRVEWLRKAMLPQRAEVQRMLINEYQDIYTTPVGRINENSWMAQEIKRVVIEGKDGKTAIRTEIKMPAKMDAGKELARLYGLYPQADPGAETSTLDVLLSRLATAGRPMEPPPSATVIDVEEPEEIVERSAFAQMTSELP